MRITSKGQVTIPQAVREAAGLMPGTTVDFEVRDDGTVLLRRAEGQGKTRGRAFVERIRGTGDYGGMTGDEVVMMFRGEPADVETERLERERAERAAREA